MVIGDGALAAKLKLGGQSLRSEEFRVVARGNHLVFLGQEGIKSEVALWAVVDFLDRELGARWLRPGDCLDHGMNVSRGQLAAVTSP